MLPPLHALCPQNLVGTPDAWSDSWSVVHREAAESRGERLQMTEGSWWVTEDEVKKDPRVLKHCNHDQKTANGGFTYERLCLFAVRQSGEVLEFVHAAFLPGFKDGNMAAYFEICTAATDNAPTALRYMPRHYKALQTANFGPQLGLVFASCVERDGMMLRYVPIGTKSFERLASAAVEKTHSALQFVPPTRSYFVTLAENAIEQHVYSLNMVPKAHAAYDYLTGLAQAHATPQQRPVLMRTINRSRPIDDKYGPEVDEWEDTDEYGDVEAPALV